MTYRLIIEPSALKMLGEISDRRIQEKIRDRIDHLADEPEQHGRPLTGEFAGYRSLRAVGQRYRIIYRMQKDQRLVLVVAIGIRKEGSKADIYALAKKLLRLRLVTPER